MIEYESIINALGGVDPNFAVIPPSEFVVDIRRVTDAINNFGLVKYKILTRVAGLDDETFFGDALKASSHSHSHSHSHHHTKKYIAKLLVEPNPGIGPNIVTVISIKRVYD